MPHLPPIPIDRLRPRDAAFTAGVVTSVVEPSLQHTSLSVMESVISQ